ncbi:geranylgeranylglycerol-phosphate geranylgeranyltransferase [Methanohalophilus sp.]|uniref:geranylgeranylglycerol-phosphate geranylgeranyltransferase n=1 Tax=Methanohalophilus sp. TaxID=1966352 RepID=UPI0026319387|nr:geranylgeranylglycerol-phosphate geranylgeranyltransferase [Methanohalophilus sp.]MDK2893039.1 geranylgeranylglycerol-phosphate geranylgeranyltransferase [Methanohalophilus sp.]
MHSYLQLMRISNCAMAAFASIIAVLITFGILEEGDGLFPIMDSLLVMVTVVLITGAGNTINDYYDIHIDSINRPQRPIPSGRVSARNALYFSFLLFAVGIFLAFWINYVCVAIAIINSFLLVLYARNLKSMPLVGNVSVGYLTGSTFLFGGAVFGIGGVYALAILFLLATFATIAREIVKDIEDMEGDMQEGAKTLPIVAGEKVSKFLASALGIIGIIASPYPYLTGLLGEGYLYLVVLADAVFIFAILAILRGNPGKSSKWFKYAMFLALFAFVAGSSL